jgi:hypothetical protein
MKVCDRQYQETPLSHTNARKVMITAHGLFSCTGCRRYQDNRSAG